MHYTLDEEKVILAHVLANGSNLRLAFEFAGTELNRSAKGVSAHWYNYLRAKSHKLFGFPGSPKNIKNLPRNYKEVIERKCKKRLAKLETMKPTTKVLNEKALITRSLHTLKLH